MKWSDVHAHILAGESTTVEFKRGADLKQLGPALAAFANTSGGILILGVDDAGHMVGVSDPPERVSERLTDYLQSGLSAPVQAEIGRQFEAGVWIHWIEVPRQRGFEPLRQGGRVYVRRGRASVEPSSTELQDLYNLFGYILTEERLIEGSHPSDIDERAFESYMKRLGLDMQDEPRLSLEDDLRIRGVLGIQGGALRATLYGVMAFGRNPQKYPQTRSFWIDCVAYAGNDRADDVLQVADCTGRLDEQVDRALGWFRSVGRMERYGAVIRQDVARVPEGALREALVNAVCHRDYAILGSKILLEVFDDEVVITSPGTLPNHMTPSSATAGGHPRSRNELMANFMLTMGFMEGRGRGWPRMRKLMQAHNQTVPTLEEDRESRWVRVTFDTRRG